ncbi:outer membrane beta-barrel protein [Seonamhaeicola sp. ML3]|uniref:outer membrane beta-barrel protein n=1 Tax=Seonamhaeicola sp. ML3 TaxID=2937786 RepID=UPI00200BEDC2|nr:outer membrane beta-barrel protein [Seonamhaeicola sp. ML3]
MSEKKHIDRLFQESFKDFEAKPSDAVWKQIEANLNKKKKRRVIPIWWRYAGVAALLLLFFALGSTFFKDDNIENPNKVVETDNSNNNPPANNTIVSYPDEKEIDEGKSNSSHFTNKNTSKQREPSVAKSSPHKTNEEIKVEKTQNVLSNQTQNNPVVADNRAVKNTHEQNANNQNIASVNSEKNDTPASSDQNKILQTNSNHAIAKSKSDSNNNNNQALALNEKEEKTLTIEEALKENKDNSEITKKTNRWAVVPNAAPVYFNTLGQGSSIDPQFNNNSKSGEVNMSYGISASYALNDKFSIRSGIHRVSLGYNTNNVVILQTAGVSSQSSLRNIRESGPRSVASSNNLSVASEANFNDVPLAFNSTNSTLNQAFGYIEVPLEIQYALSNKKLGVHVIGGFSSLFLNNNEIFSESKNGNRLFLGEASNLNKVSYSANFGLGFNYHISKRLDLNLEPMFKYQFNAFNNTSGNFTPFFIGVYSGFAIKF